MLDTVQNLVFIVTENDVAVFAHQLNDEKFPAKIAHVVQVLDLKRNDALQAGLGDGHDAAAADVLAQQHAEIGRRHGAGFVLGGKIRQRQGGTG